MRTDGRGRGGHQAPERCSADQRVDSVDAVIRMHSTHRPRPLPRVAFGVVLVRDERHGRVEAALKRAAACARAHELGAIVPNIPEAHDVTIRHCRCAGRRACNSWTERRTLAARRLRPPPQLQQTKPNRRTRTCKKCYNLRVHKSTLPYSRVLLQP